MTARGPRNIVASVRDRLRTLARRADEDFNFTLMRYSNERFLNRLSRSEHRRDFVLKGAMLLPRWGAELARPTRDIDLLGFGDPAVARLTQVFSEIANLPVEPDGMEYQADQMGLETIQGTQDYGGVRIRVPGNLGNILLPIQVDIGFGDTVTPAPVEASYPTLLDLPAPVLTMYPLEMYPLETVVAEKFEALRRFALANTRLKDYYDRWTLAKTQSLDGQILVEAITSTFAQRGTRVPVSTPSGLSPDFVDDLAKRRQWTGFLRRVAPQQPAMEFQVVAQLISDFLMPVARAAATGGVPPRRWDPEAGWS